MFKEKTKKIIKENKAIVDTPAVLFGLVCIMFLIVIFGQSASLASRGFQLRETANSITKQIGVSGEINEDTVSLAESYAKSLIRDLKDNDERTIYISIEKKDALTGSYMSNIQVWTLQAKGSTIINSDFNLKNNVKTIGTGDSQKTFDNNKVQLGDVAIVRVQLQNEVNQILGDNKTNEHGFTEFYTNNEPMVAKSTAVSQVYWKELDFTEQ